MVDNRLEDHRLGFLNRYSSEPMCMLCYAHRPHTRVRESLDDFLAVDIDVEFAVLLLRVQGMNSRS